MPPPLPIPLYTIFEGLHACVHLVTSGTTNVLPAPTIVPFCLAGFAAARLVQAVRAIAAITSTAIAAAVARFRFTLCLSSLRWYSLRRGCRGASRVWAERR